MSSNQNVMRQTKAVFAYLQAIKEEKSDQRLGGVLELQRMCDESRPAIDELRRLIYQGDGFVRLCAAEALSRTASYADDAIPVFQAVLDVVLDNNWTDSHEHMVKITLEALTNYEDAAVIAEQNVFPYVHTHDNMQLKLYAIQAIGKFARVSVASWTVLCLLCKNEDQTLKKYADDMMNSKEFEQYMKRLR